MGDGALAKGPQATAPILDSTNRTLPGPWPSANSAMAIANGAAPPPPGPASMSYPCRGHRRRGDEVVADLIPFARAQIDLAETEMAMGDEGTHPQPLGKGQRLAIMSLAALGIELIGVGCDVAE
jgi:hypothetical protein